MQLISCIFQIVAIFVEELRDAAAILELIADLATLSVAGCMGAQVYHEVKKFKENGGVTMTSAPPVAMATPVAVAQPIGAPLVNEEMER